MYFFTADEHYGHTNIITYCERPFDSVEEMDNEIVARHNAVVTDHDTVIHAGDFTLIKNQSRVQEYISRLNGTHLFVRGSHDYWLDDGAPYLLEIKERKRFIVVCHYAMRVWNRSHYNSWQVHGHSHGKLRPEGKQWDVGVDRNGFAPVSMVELESIMAGRPDNFNLVKSSERVHEVPAMSVPT